MYVRIARFEGVEDNWDERIETIRKRWKGESDQGLDEEARGLVKRGMMLMDRENGRGAGLLFAESAEDVRRLDEVLNRMTPPSGGGQRASVEIYEIAVDEQF